MFIKPRQIISTLHKSGMFEDFELDDDEAEHSLEMQLPFIAKVGSFLPITAKSVWVFGWQ